MKKSVLMAGDHKSVMAHNSFGGRTLDFGCGTIRDCAISYRLVTLSPSISCPPFLQVYVCISRGSDHAISHYRRFIGNLIWLTRQPSIGPES